MQIRSIKYPLFTLYEIIRSIILLKVGALTVSAILPVTWYAGLPLLCIGPFIFIILAADEEKYATWLQLVSLIKALCVITLSCFIVVTLPDAIRAGSAGDLALLRNSFLALLFIIGDIILGLYCFRRNRTLCK